MDPKGLLSLLLLFAICSLASAASFDCNKASTFVEKRVCANPTLGGLDEEMAKKYREAVSKYPDQTKERQKKWLVERNGCQDDRCIESKYRMQILMLMDISATDARERAYAKRAEAYSEGEGATKPQSSSEKDAFNYISQNKWTIWGGTCRGKPHYLSVTYSIDNGQMLYKDGVLTQDMNPKRRPNARFAYAFDIKNGFTYRQTLYIDNSSPFVKELTKNQQVIATDVVETIVLIDKAKIRVTSQSKSINTEKFLKTGVIEYKEESSETTETLCN